jgi:hypothetical protein
MAKPKEKRITTAKLILNSVKAPVSIIEFDSSEMSKKQVLDEVKKRFGEMLSFEYEEKSYKK